ncbi:MAG: TIGR03087 family PEP-CTERM/XrtA system glycosyltransferase [Burkholderiales bacterium]|nr:TIGR03087 family PEP-CTERM/XrtA system glycosyltransferase [Burkholderiales bacterium]
MEELLFLAHRIPFPPDKGDKIRSFHVLRFLAQHYRVHLGAFIDDPLDWTRADELGQFCGETHFERLGKRRATARALTGFASGRALTLPYYSDSGMAAWVKSILARRPISAVFVYSAAMGQYIESANDVRRIIDFVDVDSDKWRQYKESLSGVKKWVYSREAERLLRYERRLAQLAEASFFVSAAEAALFRRLAPEAAGKIAHYNNGVDLDFFSPQHRCDSPYAPGERGLVFTGAMDYWPNVDAVVWFAREILPGIRSAVADATFYIVGSNPSAEVMQLDSLPGVRVTGRVDDVRPYVRHAAAAVAPLRLARGVQNKVLEAMACGKATVVTSQALEGIEAQAGRDVVLADSPGAFAAALIRLLAQPDPELEANARKLVESRYGWERNLAHVMEVLRPASGVGTSSRSAAGVTTGSPSTAAI